MKQANIYMHDIVAGILSEDEEGFHFTYDSNYLESKDAEAISLSIPLSHEKISSKMLFPFFDGLIPEGWLLEITLKNWKVDFRDRMGILLATCHDCIGAVSVKELKSENNE